MIVIAAGSMFSGGAPSRIPRWPLLTRPPEICAIKPVRTNTPLQSFVTLNDPVYVEAAQALARRIVCEGGTLARPRAIRAGALPVPASSARTGRAVLSLYSVELERYRKDRAAAAGTGHRADRPPPGWIKPGRDGGLDRGRQRPLEPRCSPDQRLTLMAADRELTLPLLWQQARAHTRRQFLKLSHAGLGAIALAMFMDQGGRARCEQTGAEGSEPGGVPVRPNPLAVRPPHFPPRANRVIYLHMSGGPPQQDLFDYKPALVRHHMQPCPDSLLKGQKFAFIKGHPKLLGSPYKFQQCGHSGAELSELWTRFRTVVDDVAIIKSMWTDQFNHAPAELLLYTGSARSGGAAMGSWITYGLGTENQDLPGFVVLISGGTDPTGGKASGAPGFCPACIKECNAGPWATRCCMSAIPRAWTARTAAGRSISCGSSTSSSSRNSVTPRL